MLYSDGLIEGFSGGYAGADKLDRLWNTGLLTLLGEHRDPALAGLPTHLVERAEELNGGPLVDDVAILLLSCAGALAGPPPHQAAGRARSPDPLLTGQAPAAYQTAPSPASPNTASPKTASMSTDSGSPARPSLTEASTAAAGPGPDAGADPLCG
jgi:hypothetical protein